MSRNVFEQAQVSQVNGSGVFNRDLISHFEVAVVKRGRGHNVLGNSKVCDHNRRRIVGEAAVAVFVATVFAIGIGAVVTVVLSRQWIAVGISDRITVLVNRIAATGGSVLKRIGCAVDAVGINRDRHDHFKSISHLDRAARDQ